MATDGGGNDEGGGVDGGGGGSDGEEAGKTAGTRDSDEMIDEEKSEKMLSSSAFGQCL